DDAVRSHTEGVAHQVADRDLAAAFDVRRTGFHRQYVVLVELELLGILDGDDALVVGDEGRQHVEGGRLTGAGTAGDDAVEAPDHAGLEEAVGRRVEGAEPDQVFDGVRVGGELPDGQEGPADGQRVHDGV